MDEYIYSDNKSKMFPLLKRLTNYDSFEKRDGSIMKKAISKVD